MAMGRGKVDMTEKGFTLIEVMIALAIFSIGILSIIGMFIIGSKGIISSNMSYLAVQTAKSQMELLRNSALTNVSEEICSTITTATFQCVWSVKRDVPAEGLSTLEVITKWHEGEKNRELFLTTLRFDNNE